MRKHSIASTVFCEPTVPYPISSVISARLSYWYLIFLEVLMEISYPR